MRRGEAGTACKPCEDLSDAVERLKGRVDVLTQVRPPCSNVQLGTGMSADVYSGSQDNVKLSSDLKLARAKLVRRLSLSPPAVDPAHLPTLRLTELGHRRGPQDPHPAGPGRGRQGQARRR